MKQQKVNTCERIRPWLSAYADGELNKKQAAATHKHVCDCPSCERELEQLRQMTALLRESVECPEPSAALHASIMRAVSEMPRTATAKTARYTLLKRVSGALACVGCLAVIGVAVMLGGINGGVKNESFDHAMSPEAEKPMAGASDNDGNGNFPTADQAPNEPSLPPMDVENPEYGASETLKKSYVLDRISGESNALEGEWAGADLSLTFSPENEQVKMLFNGEDVHEGTYKASDTELTIWPKDGECMSFDWSIKEGRLWLIRK